MEFGLTDDQQALVAAAREFSAAHLAPHYRDRDREGALHRETLLEMGKLGFFGVELPEKLGGLGESCLTAGLVVEALCGVDLNLGYVTINISFAGADPHHTRPA